MKHQIKNSQLPEKNIVKPLTFNNINVIKDLTSSKDNYDTNVLFINPDGSDKNNNIFEAPNAYNYVINEVNKPIYDFRCMLNSIIENGTEKKHVDIDHVDFYNKILSANVVNKMLDEIEYNCNIICEAGMHRLIKNFFIHDNGDHSYDNSVGAILRFASIRALFSKKYLLHRYDMIGEYVVFEEDPEKRFTTESRPTYCRDNNVLNTMLNLKAEILSDLSRKYGEFISFVIGTNAYDIRGLCKFLMGSDYNESIVDDAMACSFIVSCLNEQSARDIAKMDDMIEISLMSALHYFMDNVQIVEQPKSLKDLPGINNYKKLPDGTEICEF